MNRDNRDEKDIKSIVMELNEGEQIKNKNLVLQQQTHEALYWGEISGLKAKYGEKIDLLVSDLLKLDNKRLLEDVKITLTYEEKKYVNYLLKYGCQNSCCVPVEIGGSNEIFCLAQLFCGLGIPFLFDACYQPRKRRIILMYLANGTTTDKAWTACCRC